MERQKHSFISNGGGFTLLEIMIVVAIIALLAAIAIPNLLRARHNANETAAIAALRTVSTAEESFRAAQTPVTYGDFDALIDAVPPYLNMTDTDADNITRQGYTMTLAGADTNSYCVASSPETSGTTGTRVFVVDSAGVVYGTSAGDDPACTAVTPFAWDGNGAALE